MAQVETYQLSTDGSEPVERLSVANRGYHQLSFSEIGGGKRISRHLSGFSEEFRIVDNPGVNPVRSGVLRQSQGNFSVALEPLISTRLARRPFAFWMPSHQKLQRTQDGDASRIFTARALSLPFLGRNYMIRRSTVRITRVAIAMAPIDMR